MRHGRPPNLARALAVACAFFTACASTPAPVESVLLPDRGSVLLRPFSTFDSRAIDESSGIVASRRYPGLYWTHNDSGGTPEIYAVDANGALVGSPVRVLGARNVDWEDIAADDEGNLWIADIGNNLNSRTDLRLYVLPEPDPRRAEECRVSRTIDIRYPDQILFPPPRWNYDGEALFVLHGKPYLLSKHRADSLTTLYRLDLPSDGLSAPLTLLATFDVHGMVTAADSSVDGKRLAVLTYTGIWLFEARREDEYFAGAIRWLPISALQCEALCFAPEGSLLIGNEQGQLFRLEPDELVRLRD